MLEIQSSLTLVLTVVLFGIKVWALVDCFGRDSARLAAANTLPRRNWLIILGLVVLVHALTWNPLGLLNLIGTVAALVYLAQVRSTGR